MSVFMIESKKNEGMYQIQFDSPSELFCSLFYEFNILDIIRKNKDQKLVKFLHETCYGTHQDDDYFGYDEEYRSGNYIERDRDIIYFSSKSKFSKTMFAVQIDEKLIKSFKELIDTIYKVRNTVSL